MLGMSAGTRNLIRGGEDSRPCDGTRSKDMNCSVARTLSVVGERWTMLILRRRFSDRPPLDEFSRAPESRAHPQLAAGDQVSDGILDARAAKVISVASSIG